VRRAGILKWNAGKTAGREIGQYKLEIAIPSAAGSHFILESNKMETAQMVASQRTHVPFSL
jgi:hypothetical protein